MCEVALGNSKHMTHGFYVEDIPNYVFQSVKGVGYGFPSQYQYIDGILAPLYGISMSGIPTTLDYNEYIVYNPNQVKIKYLFKIKFNYEDY